MTRLWLVLVAVVVGGLVGCGGGDGPKQVSLDDVRKTELSELGELLKSLAAENKKPPAKPADVTDLEPFIPTAGAALRNGEVVYFWGAAYSAGGTAVVAHEKKVPTDGGVVLLENGTVKQMSAAEFAAAPKAGKK